jgi:hypothetical protein
MQAIELDFDQPNFFCPMTGRQILSEEACTPSPATVFVYIQDENVFHFVREDLRQSAEEIETDDGDDENDGVETGPDGQPRLRRPFEAMQTALPQPSVVDFVIRTCGIACGPTSLTVHIGIDMNWTGEATGAAE